MAKAKKEVTKSKQSLSNVFLKRPLLWLMLLCAVVYGRSLWLGFTELDDNIFIKEMQEYNSHVSNIATSFHRGVFNATKDIYYRPVLMADFIIENQIFGIDIAWYHFTNLLFHVVVVVLLFLLFKKLKLGDMTAFILAALFAVHPVLTQAVVWIPGRNDMLLCIFLLGSLLSLIKYVEAGKVQYLALCFVLFLVALFTKETAYVFPVVCVLYVLLLRDGEPVNKRSGLVLSAMAGAFVIYFLVKAGATLGANPAMKNVAGLLIYRVPVLFQYIGKIFLPFNLSVYPVMEDTSIVPGVLCTLLLIAAIVYFKLYKNAKAIWGLLWFGVFVVPLLLVPKEMNDQLYEHRLYIPLIGMLVVVGEMINILAANRQKEKQYLSGGVVLVFSVLSIYRAGFFNDPITFWSRAVVDAPHSPTAKTFLAMRLYHDKLQRQKAVELYREAYALNPDERYLNFYLGEYYLDNDSAGPADMHFRKEINTTNYFEAYFGMATAKFKKNEKDSAIVYLEKESVLNPYDERAYNNLTMMYMERQNVTAAKDVVQRAQAHGVTLNPDMVKAVMK